MPFHASALCSLKRKLLVWVGYAFHTRERSACGTDAQEGWRLPPDRVMHLALSCEHYDYKVITSKVRVL